MFPMAAETYQREGIEENVDRVVEHYLLTHSTVQSPS